MQFLPIEDLQRSADGKQGYSRGGGEGKVRASVDQLPGAVVSAGDRLRKPRIVFNAGAVMFEPKSGTRLFPLPQVQPNALSPYCRGAGRPARTSTPPEKFPLTGNLFLAHCAFSTPRRYLASLFRNASFVSSFC
jgi:hypothetical protein